MRNNKEWFSAAELVGKGRLPTSTQGINKKARIEQWEKRKKSGISGKGVEYHYTSFPLEVQRALGFTPTVDTLQENKEPSILEERFKAIETSLKELETTIKQNKGGYNSQAGRNFREGQILFYFRQLSDEQQELAVKMLEAMTGAESKKENDYTFETREVA